MSNRVLRDWTKSEKIDQLSAKAEVFFTRLIMKADDFGYYDANPKLLKSALYPLRDGMKITEIPPLLDECERAGLLVTYEYGGKPYLFIHDFGQRLRKMYSNFPTLEMAQNKEVPQNADSRGQLAAVGGEARPETETEKETETENKRVAQAPPPPAQISRSKLKEELPARCEKFRLDLVPFVGTYTKEMVRAFFDYWREPNPSQTKMRFELEKTFDISLRLTTWAKRENNFNKPGGNTSNKNEEYNVKVRQSEKQEAGEQK